MASISSETSFWIKFFTEAGIPAGDSAHYAILFSDNRISKEMLLDLSKEYLNDMGITRLGDVISILKHAKHVHQQEAKDLLLKSSSLTLRSSSPSVNSPRRSTAASRMVNHFTSKHPEAGPMSQQPVPRPVSPDVASSKRKVSVFDRLGAESGDITVSVPKTSPKSGDNVFSRLGGKSALKRAASSTSLNEQDSGVSSNSLPYVGVLKGSGSPTPTRKRKRVEIVPSVKMSSLKKIENFQIKKTINSTDSGAITVSSIQRPEVSTTEGVLSDFAKRGAPSLRDRLGSKTAKTELPSSTTTSKMDRVKANIKKANANLQKRLGAKREEPSSSPVVSSTQNINLKLKKAKEISLRTARQDEEQVSGVFSRLGRKSKA